MHITLLSLSRVAAIAALALSGSAYAAGQDGQTVFKDPQSGQLRAPTADEAKQFNALRAQERAERKAAQAAARKPGDKIPGVVVRKANGIAEAVLDEDSISYSMVTRTPAGELVVQCVNGDGHADSTHTHAATTQSKEHQHEVQ